MAKWYVSAKKADFAAIGAKFGIDQVTARIIRNRGVIGDDAVNEFLNLRHCRPGSFKGWSETG